MRNKPFKFLKVGAATALTALLLSFAAPALADEGITATPTTETAISAPATTPTPEPTAAQEATPAPAAETTPVVEAAPVAATAPAVEAPPTPAVTAAPAPVVEHTTQPVDSAKEVAPTTLPAPPAKKSDEATPKKVFVCKFVGTPGVNERLKAGKNPISVSVSSIKNWDGNFPGFFADAQGRSYAIAYDSGQSAPDASACPTPVAPCTSASAVSWTNNANLSMATVTLKKGYTSCDVSLNSYETEGSTWATSGTQTPVDHATVHLTADNSTGTLTVMVRGCFQQQDLYIGTTRYDGVDGALPHWPTTSTPDGLLTWWNGAAECTPPPTPVEGTPTITVVGPTCDAPYNTVSYSIPSGLNMDVMDLYDVRGSGSLKAEDHPDARGDGSNLYGHWSAPVRTNDGNSYDGAVTVEYDLIDPATLDCNTPTPTPVTPVDVWFHDSCGITDDSVQVPGKLDSTTTEGNVTRSQYSTDQGQYFVTDTTTDGVRTATVLFRAAHYEPIAPPTGDSTYVVVTDKDVQFAKWTFTFTDEPCPLTVITTPPAPTVVPATCTAQGSLPPIQGGEGYTAAYNRSFDGAGSYKAVYTAKPGIQFANGLTTASYDLTVEAKLTKDCVTATPTPTPTPTPPVSTPTATTPPTILSSNGGANTGLFGTEPGASASFWNAFNPVLFGGFGLALLLIAGAIVVWARRKTNPGSDATGVESL